MYNMLLFMENMKEANCQYMCVFWLHACVLGHLQKNNAHPFQSSGKSGEKECDV